MLWLIFWTFSEAVERTATDDLTFRVKAGVQSAFSRSLTCVRLINFLLTRSVTAHVSAVPVRRRWCRRCLDTAPRDARTASAMKLWRHPFLDNIKSTTTAATLTNKQRWTPADDYYTTLIHIIRTHHTDSVYKCPTYTVSFQTFLLTIKTKLVAVSLCCKRHGFKTANFKISSAHYKHKN